VLTQKKPISVHMCVVIVSLRSTISCQSSVTCGSRIATVTPCIANCLFDNLSHGGSGGAIYFTTSSTATVEISSTVFHKCRCTGSNVFGGAYYGSVDIQTLRQCCFRECSSEPSGQAIYLSKTSFGGNPTFAFKASSCYRCGSQFVTAQSGTVAIANGVDVNTYSEYFVGLNFTSCCVSGDGAAILLLTSYTSGSVACKNGLVMFCKGSSIIFGSRGTSPTFSSIGFYHNNASSGVICTSGTQNIKMTACRFVETSRIAWGLSKGLVRFEY
jgi:hypothetical protein